MFPTEGPAAVWLCRVPYARRQLGGGREREGGEAERKGREGRGEEEVCGFMSVSVHVCVLECCTQRVWERETHTHTHTGAKSSIEGPVISKALFKPGRREQGFKYILSHLSWGRWIDLSIFFYSNEMEAFCVKLIALLFSTPFYSAHQPLLMSTTMLLKGYYTRKWALDYWLTNFSPLVEPGTW